MSKVPVMILEWTPVLAVHVPEIDREHQMFFDILNRLHQAMLAGKGKEIIKTLIGEVTQYAQDHFAHEEKLMVAVRYPGLREHVQEHNVLRHGVGPFVARVAREEATMTIEFMLYLSNWIKQHIKTADWRLGEYIRTTGGGSAVSVR